MTFVVELRDLKRGLPRPLSHFWQRAAKMFCALRLKLAFISLLCLALDWPADGKLAPRSGVLASVCGVLTAAVSATLTLMSDACSGLSALFSDDLSALFPFGQGLSLCLEGSVFPFDVCRQAGTFPAFSGYSTLALLACALLLFGCSFSRQKPGSRGRMH